jgi:uncharacterized protein
MRQISQILLLAVSFLIFASSSEAQTVVSPEKRKLIGEMVTLLKMDTQMSQITDQILQEMEKTYPMGFASVVDSRNDLTVEQKKTMKATAGPSFTAFSQKFRKRLMETVDYGKYIQESLYPIYDKVYTEQELKDLIAFYGTPTGKKVIETMPQLFAEAQTAAREKLLPQVLPIIETLVKEEFEALEQPVVSKKPSR